MCEAAASAVVAVLPLHPGIPFVRCHSGFEKHERFVPVLSPKRSSLVLRFLRSALLVVCCLSLAFVTTSNAEAATAAPRAKIVAARLGRMSPQEQALFKKWVQHQALEQFYEALRAFEESERVTCGGDLPDCYIAQRESKFNPCAVNPGHQGAFACTGTVDDPGDPATHASGKWQFMPGTWNDYDGYPYAAAAPASVQNDKAREVWAGGAGAGNWACC